MASNLSNRMKVILMLIGMLALSQNKAFGQSIVDVAEISFKVGAINEEVFHYGFAEGDQLIFNFQEVNGKELKEIEIIELPGSSKFMDYKSKKIENKTLNIVSTGIYKFRFSNSAMSARICKVKIQRIPASELTKKFNSTVYWRTVQDTSYIPVEEKYLVSSDTVAQEVYSANPQVSSKNAINGNKNHQVVDFFIPKGTVSWSFYIATGTEGKQEYDDARDNFTKNAASSLSKMPGYGPMAALALTGVSYFNKVQGADNVKYWFLADANSVQLFLAGQDFYQYKSGDVISEASQMKYPLFGQVYLAISNDNTMDPISVTIRAVAIVVNQKWDTRIVQSLKIVNKLEPYLKN